MAVAVRSPFALPSAIAFAALCAAVVPCRAQPQDKLPDEAAGIGITEKVGAQLPLDARFIDDAGNEIRLRDYFDGKHPVLLTLNYYSCPMLCGEQLKGLLEALKAMDWTPGKEFQILTVSFDPLEDARLAGLKKQNYIQELGRGDAALGWHFLTGRKTDIQNLTSTVGFAYRWVEERREWSHSAALILCTPDGKVARYLGGLYYDPKVLRLSLVEASRGKVGSLADQFFLWCFHYEPGAGKYTATVINIMRMGGLATLLLLSVGLLGFWRREARRRVASHASENSTPQSA